MGNKTLYLSRIHTFKNVYVINANTVFNEKIDNYIRTDERNIDQFLSRMKKNNSSNVFITPERGKLGKMKI